ncbi:subtilisin-like protein [Lactarius psammicola]|nr:subtilisin-like protein [Lactarius psammicola]
MRCHRISVLSVLVTFPLVGLTTLAHSSWDDTLTKHSWNAVPSKWETLGHPPAGTTIDLCVALKPQHENALIDVLYEEQVAELVAPHPDTLELVHSWLGHHNVPFSSVSVTHGGSSLTLAGVPISRANSLLGASATRVCANGGANDVLFFLAYAVAGTAQALQQGSSEVEKVASGEPVMVLSNRDENDDTTPSFLRWLYKTWGYTPTATDRNKLGILGLGGQYPSPWDLGAFMDKYRYGAYATFFLEQVNGGGFNPSNPGKEANLDIQYAEAIAYPTPHIFYSIGVTPWGDDDDSYISWLNYILKQSRIPQTISVSYGNEEKDYPIDHAIYECYLFAQLGARGVSVLFASGDYGVGKGDCNPKDGSGKVRFATLYPGTCPFVTSVGGTTGYPEVAAGLSGGGFSSFFARPPYQQRVVSKFLEELGNQHQGLFNPFGRGVPDISAQALQLPIILGGDEYIMFGTSGSTTIVAGIISLLNDYRISQGKRPLGFLNFLLYGSALSGLNDITKGSNPGCNTDGFPAIAGWDPVTGLGTPDFERLQKILVPNPTD